MFIYKKLQEEDKVLHIKYSAIILCCFYFIFPMLIAAVFTFFIGLSKELWDHYYGSGFCLYDMLANIVGMFASFILLSVATILI